MRIQHLSTALPRQEFTTDRLLSAFPALPESVKQNVLNLGVKKRYLIESNTYAGQNEQILSERGLVDLCREACEKAMCASDLRSRNVDYLITTYDANPFLSPGLSHLLVPELALHPQTK